MDGTMILWRDGFYEGKCNVEIYDIALYIDA